MQKFASVSAVALLVYWCLPLGAGAQISPVPPPARGQAYVNKLIADSQAAAAIGTPPIDDENWYFCDASGYYYPWVQGCPVAWKKVLKDPGVDLPPLPPQASSQQNGVFHDVYADRFAEIRQTYLEQLQAYRLERLREQQAAVAASQAQKEREAYEKKGYRFVTIPDFDLDAKTYKPSQKIVITGMFEVMGEADWLTNIPYADNAINIGLLSEDSPRDVRAALQRCRLSKVCRITLTGHTQQCKITNFGVAYKDAVCLHVDAIGPNFAS